MSSRNASGVGAANAGSVRRTRTTASRSIRVDAAKTSGSAASRRAATSCARAVSSAMRSPPPRVGLVGVEVGAEVAPCGADVALAPDPVGLGGVREVGGSRAGRRSRPPRLARGRRAPRRPRRRASPAAVRHRPRPCEPAASGAAISRSWSTTDRTWRRATTTPRCTAGLDGAPPARERLAERRQPREDDRPLPSGGVGRQQLEGLEQLRDGRGDVGDVAQRFVVGVVVEELARAPRRGPGRPAPPSGRSREGARRARPGRRQQVVHRRDAVRAEVAPPVVVPLDAGEGGVERSQRRVRVDVPSDSAKTGWRVGTGRSGRDGRAA